VAFITGEFNPDDPKWEEVEQTVAPHPIEITYGYSRDHRPDLKQFILDLICSGDGDVPLFLQVADGNEADKAVFAQVLCNFRKQLTLDTLMVADSALYSAPNLEEIKGLKWVCRVPLTVKQAKQLVSELNEKEFVKSALKGYSVAYRTSNYGAIAQRWLVVESQVRQKADRRHLEQRLDKAEQEAHKQVQRLRAQKFTCHQAAIEAAQTLAKKLKYHSITEIQVVELLPDQSKKASIKVEPSANGNITYQIQATLLRNQSVIESETRRAGRFVLATNVLDVNELSNDEILSEYKAQQSAERGFGFLKDPLFFTDSVFLKSPERVEALAMLMGLCLLVYTLAQRQLRQALNQSQSGIKNQLGKLTERPTLRWVFQCFQAIHVLIVKGVKQISNLTDERLWILRFFPEACRRYYLLL
jgi:transposase